MQPAPDPRSEYSVLVVDDDPGIRQSIRLCLEADRARVVGVGAGRAAFELLDRSPIDVVFLDLWLGRESGLALLPDLLRRRPGVGVVVITAYASFESAVEAMRLGAADYLPKPFTPEQVRGAARRVLAAGTIQRQHAELGARIEASLTEHVFESRSAAYRLFLDAAGRAAATDSVVLLGGESGTGKSVLARWLHARSPRADRGFVSVHGAAFVGDLDLAEGGTLFLDEVGDLSADAQARLLPFLHDPASAGVRVIAASNRALEADVASGRLREDLFFRLHVISLRVPPLRDRREDLVPLALHFLRFLERSRGRHGLTLSADAEHAITSHAWPGNVRELRNAIERAVVFAPSSTIEPRDLGLTPGPVLPAAAARRTGNVGDEISLEDLEREHIAQVIARTTTLEAAARILGIDPTTLQRKRKRYGLV